MNSTSVADAVKYFPGVLVKDYGGIGGLKTISVRSLGANHTGVVYDGIMLSEAQAGQIDLGKFSLQNIEEITLYIPQSTSTCQPARNYSTASVFDVISLRPPFVNNHSANGSVSIKTGSFGLFNPSANVNYKWSKHIVSTLNTEWQQANGEYPYTLNNGDSTKKTNRTNSDIKALRLELNNRFSISDSNTIQLKAYYYNSDRGLPGAVILYNPISTQRLWDKQFFVQSSWEKSFSAKSKLLVNAKYTDSYNRYLNPEYLNAEHKIDNTYKQKEAYVSGAYSYQLLRYLNLSYSSDALLNTLKTNIEDFATPTRYTFFNNVALKLNWDKLIIQANALSTIVSNEVKSGPKPANYNKITPAISVSYQPFGRIPVRARFFYKDIFRMPTFNDLYYTNIGNTNLRPEFAKQYNLGLTWQQNFSAFILKAVSITTDGYYNNVRDKIVAVPGQNLFQWTMINFGKVEIKGLDAGVQLFFKPLHEWRFSIRGNYTYQQALDKTDPTTALYNSQLPYTPKHSGSGNIGIDYKAFSFSYNILVSGSRYRLGENIPYNYLPSWVTQDATASYTIDARRSGLWKITTEVNNIFNKQYDIIKYYPMPGISYRVGLNFTLN